MTEKFDDPCALNPPSKPPGSFSSWSEAFSAAKSVTPHDLGDFKPAEQSSSVDKWGAGNICMLSEIAKEYNGKKRKMHETSVVLEEVKKKVKKKHKEDKKRKKEKKNHKQHDVDQKEEVSDEEEIYSPTEFQRPLEGQIFSHKGNQLMILLDKEKGIVYSMDRNTENELIPIGTIEDKQIVIHDDLIWRVQDTNLNETTKFPYEVDADDHCESPFIAYSDILPILEEMAKLEMKKKRKLVIYDPYFCNGAVVEHLQTLGFPKVYNRKEDAYKTWDPNDNSQPYPKYDVLVTNPPYSGNHPERLITHLQDERMRGKPWALLMPNYIYKKDFYKDLVSKISNLEGMQPFYLVPKKRYVYTPPKHFRDKKVSDVHRKSSPFVSMWYIWGGSSEKTKSLIKSYSSQSNSSCNIARTTNALRDLRRNGKNN